MYKKMICLVCFVLILGLTAGTAVAELVAYYSLDEGSGNIATDISGNGHDGQIQGTPTWVDSMPGYGKALYYNGVNPPSGWINCGTWNPSEGTNQLSVALWAKWDGDADEDGWQGLIGKREGWTDDGSTMMWCIEIDRDSNVCQFFRGGSYPGGGVVLPVGEWTHVAATFDGTNALFYINGEQTGGGAFSLGPMTDATIAIGCVGGEAWNTFNGILDDVYLYNHALTPEELQDVMLGEMPFAFDPDPPDGSIYKDTWAILSWTPGTQAVSHDVYFGDNFNDVEAGTGGTFYGNQSDPYFLVGYFGYPYPDGLVPGTTYYWRIDEVNDVHPDSPWKGSVWSFTVPFRKAHKPNPADGALFVDPNINFSWEAGLGTKVHQVYFGTDEDAIRNATTDSPEYKGQTITTTYEPGSLELEKTYYWRVDESDVITLYKGDVWSFTTTIPSLGKIVQEIWNNIPEWSVDNLRNDPRYPHSPDETKEITAFDTGTNLADNYGGRVHGWLYVPVTGDYTFWLCADDQGELWLSTDDDASNVRLIATESSWAPAYTWRSGEQQSDPIPLLGGNKYYIMALWKDGEGGDQCQVAWQGTGAPIRTIIPGSNLSPYEPLTAFGPKPGNGATNVTQTPVLGWKAGIQATSHEVYFGTDKDAVKNATKTSPEYKGTRALGDESYDTGKLDWESTYYWRVDEVNTVNPDSPWVGSVWSFTTANFLIIDDFEGYNAGANQIWYAWRDGLGFGAIVTPPYSPGNGTGSEVGDGTTTSYTEENIVNSGRQSMPYWYNNNKPDKAKYSEAKLTMGTNTRDWSDGGIRALSLWFQGYPASVGSFTEGPTGTYTMTASGTDITGPSDEFHYAYKTLNGPGTIVARVDSVQNTNEWAKAGVMIRETLDPNSAHAMVFVTPGQGVVFEYRPVAGEDNVSAAGQQTGITAPHWVKLERDISGLFTVSHSANGSTWEPIQNAIATNIPMSANVLIGLAVTAHDAALTCQAVFSNVTTSGVVSGQWMHQDIGILSNAPEPMYVAVANRTGTPAVVYHNNPNAAQIDTWTEWNIDLKDFADKGVVLTDVNSIAIGFGDRNNPQAGGSGKMYFDDIRLYRSRYIPGMGTPLAGDLNGDGLVDFGDIEIMADGWLTTDSYIATTAPSGSPVGWWKFENNTNDSAGAHHGTANGSPGYAAGIDGQAISLDGINDYVSVGSVGISGAASRTIAGWAKANATVMPDWTNVFGFTNDLTSGQDGRSFDIQHTGVTGTTYNGYGIHVYGWEQNMFPVDLEWHHLAATYDGTTIKWYGDGVLIGSEDRVLDTLDNVQMGKRGDYENYFPGLVDDVRIYNYALSDAEIAYLVDRTAGDGQLYVPVPSVANIYEDEPEGSRSVDFKDFAVLAEQWLQQQMWPDW